MKKLIIAISLTLASSATFANGFSPWQDRYTLTDSAVADGRHINAENVGLAPWRDQEAKGAFAEEKGVAMEIVEHNIFRPWS